MIIDQNSPALAALARDFAYGRKFVAWTGSGISRAVGLPSWEQLRKKLEGRLSAIAARAMPILTPEERMGVVSHIRSLPDHWDAFEALKARLPPAEYVNAIRMALDDSGVEDIPSALRDIWSDSNIEGMVTLNMDGLASRAFSSVFAGRRDVVKANGYGIRAATRILSEYKPFLIQLHGSVDDESTWIFTKSERQRLFRDERYDHFCKTLMSSKRIVFFGCSPDDIAVAAHLKHLKTLTGLPLQHYWVVSEGELSPERRVDLSTLGISTIEYKIDENLTEKQKSDAHYQAIRETFKYLQDYQYREPDPDPVNPMAPPTMDRLPPERVQALQPEQARNLLSRYASAILEGDATEYQAFLDAYGPAIAVASFVPKDPGALFFGHSISKEIGSGAFSRVFRAASPDGQSERAVKLVRNEVRDDPTMLRSFRRGVSSMKILSDREIDGMVYYDQAYEIPPCVIMPFVDGQNLEKAASNPAFSFVDEGISIARRVGEIVKCAHELPERVLHRDIRPSNIMIMPESVSQNLDDRVFVLDFDLSWHEGADGDSPISPNMTTVLGYLAPEQILQDLSVSARNSKVDSYGLCMTLFFLLERNHPGYQQRGARDWGETIGRLGARIRDKRKWKSWVPRLRRLIDHGTDPNQDLRYDFNIVVNELKLLEKLRDVDIVTEIHRIYDSVSLEAVAEEMLAQTIESDQYLWDSINGSGTYFGARGIQLDVAEYIYNGERGVKLSVRKSFDGTQKFETVRKYWSGRGSEIRSNMKSGGWQELEANSQAYREIVLSYFSSEETIVAKAKELCRSASQSWRKLNLD